MTDIKSTSHAFENILHLTRGAGFVKDLAFAFLSISDETFKHNCHVS